MRSAAKSQVVALCQMFLVRGLTEAFSDADVPSEWSSGGAYISGHINEALHGGRLWSVVALCSAVIYTREHYVVGPTGLFGPKCCSAVIRFRSLMGSTFALSR